MSCMSSSALIWMTVGFLQIMEFKYYKISLGMQSIYHAEAEKIIIGMVGLPARGKSYISKKIYRYLNWLGFNTEVFNIGNFRRKYMCDNDIELTPEFFSKDNKQFSELREFIAKKVISDMAEYINKPYNIVAILDGTNSSKERRKKVAQQLQEQVEGKYRLVWIESVCDDEAIVADNIKKVKVHGPDYACMSNEEAQQDFEERIKKYQEYYQTLDKEEGFSYIKIINVGEGVETHKIEGYLSQKIMSYSINLAISPKRTIFLSRHGQSTFNQENRIGGNPGLSEAGTKYANNLPKVFQDENVLEDKDKTTILTSTLKRTIKTAAYLKLNEKAPIQLKVLDELNAGTCQEFTYAEIKEKFPHVAKSREQNKLTFRYPSGQSYMDVIGRLEPLIYWIEKQKYPIVIFAHQAILRCLSAYFFGIQLSKIPYIQIPLHTIIKMIPETYSFREEYFEVNVENAEIKCLSQVKKKYSWDYDGSIKFKKKATEGMVI